MAYKHGVYNTEQATSLTVPIQGSAGLQVIFGTAPIHLAKDPAAAVNTPKLVYSYKEAVEAVGYSDDFEFQPTRPLRGATLVRLPVFKKV